MVTPAVVPPTSPIHAALTTPASVRADTVRTTSANALRASEFSLTSSADWTAATALSSAWRSAADRHDDSAGASLAFSSSLLTFAPPPIVTSRNASSSAAFPRACSTTDFGIPASCATCTPKLRRLGPLASLYRNLSPGVPPAPAASAGSAVTCTLHTAPGWRPSSSHSSWKCDAKSAWQCLRAASSSAMAHAMPKPSKVDVPRPSSSMITNERGVALCRIADDSSISTMNVDRPEDR
mmetsp:Transcript_31164/g.96302  ORF Transcript_31164/g.96302 Transcript_31164/m.96302 type:complete len:238 (-) Transcript_31164:45-758(-)